MIQGPRAQQVRTYRINPKTVKKNPDKIIADIQNMADWYNRAIARAIKGGIPKIYLPARGRKIKKTGIRNVKEAERALNKMRNLAWSDVGSVRDYKRLIREAEKIYGKGRRFKLIQDPTDPTRTVAVPWGTNKKAKKYTVKESLGKIISRYWIWYWDKGQLFFDSDTAALLLDEALETGKDPITYAAQYARESLSELYNKNREAFEQELGISDYL